MAVAQGTQVGFGSSTHDERAPVEVTATNLEIDQRDGTAIFSGDVLIVQGEMRMSAPRVMVVYMQDRSGIQRLQATGGVTLVSGQDAAEGAQADYNVQDGLIEISGDVMLVRGRNVLSADRMFVDTAAGTARMSGRVKTVLQPGSAE
jgi:lipopolysaccharide export system protein LptA